MMGERARIARYFAPLTLAEAGAFDLGDDAALLSPPAGTSLVVTTDSVIESVHVLAGASAQQFAQKLVRRNLSDLAAMGATPWRYTLNLHTPYGLADAWFAEFSGTLAREQSLFDMVLVGGDSTSAEGASIHATLTCFGYIKGAALLRRGAQPEDDIYVSGTIGDAAFGLAMLQQKLPANASLIWRYHTPEPRLALGAALVGIATAALDISDGLFADIGQLCRASGVGARIAREAIPLAPAVRAMLQQNEALWGLVLNGGDDYELCFTAPAEAREDIAQLAKMLQLPLARIGHITQGDAILLCDAAGQTYRVTAEGYSHP